MVPEKIRVEVMCCLDVRPAADERVGKTPLMLGLQRLADRVRVGVIDSALPAMTAVA